MQILKQELKTKFSKNHIEDKLRNAEHQLNIRQNHLHSNPLNPLYAELEQKAVEILRKAKTDYASYISQKAKLN
ncbi:unnamed protein product [Amaranthus hypochondriacus]